MIRLNVRGHLWARLAYQFAHELGHVIADIPTWLGERVPLFEADAGRRGDTTVVARELLPVFERGGPTAWRAVRSLHAWTPPAEANLADFLEGWAEACPAGSAGVVAATSEILHVDC